jgi:hypothetical protein
MEKGTRVLADLLPMLYLLAYLGYAVLPLQAFVGLLVDPLGDFGLVVSADAQCCRKHDCSITSLVCHVAQQYSAVFSCPKGERVLGRRLSCRF